MNNKSNIGNLTSQFFANVYLNELDQFIKHQLRCRFYIRYVDDFVILDNNKERLNEIKKDIRIYLDRIRLKLHKNKCRAYRVKDGIAFLGYRVFPTHRLLARGNTLGMRRRLRKMSKAYTEGKISLDKVYQRIQSWVGHACHADTYQLRQRISTGGFSTG